MGPSNTRLWVPKAKNEQRAAKDIPEQERDYYLERRYPSFGNLVPRDVASRAAKEVCDEGRGVGPNGQGVYPRLLGRTTADIDGPDEAISFFMSSAVRQRPEIIQPTDARPFGL